MYLQGTGTNLRDNCENRNYKQTCRVQCESAYRSVHTIAKPYDCKADGRWGPGVLGDLDCKGARCGKNPATLNPDTVARCLGDVTFGGDDCGISCKSGYVPTGEFAQRIQEYCTSYSTKCATEFEQEFGGTDAYGLDICNFEVRQSHMITSLPFFQWR